MPESPDPVRKILPLLVAQRRTSLRALSIVVGKNEAYLSQFLDKGSPKRLPDDVRKRLAQELEVDDSVLRTGPAPIIDRRPGAVRRRGLEEPEDPDYLPAGALPEELTIAGQPYSVVPVYDIRASAGAGALVEDGPPTGLQVFRRDNLRRITRARLSNLSVIQVAGDSMWETLHDGDSVLVDRSVSRVVKDGIYVLLFEGELLIKRCVRDLSDGAVIVKSDNSAYPMFRVKDVEQLQVLGRVVWIARSIG